ncbi:TPA: LamG domain-containing protein [Candidatus Poribacteria bacterium]|nr:LamG domain-containing protein [Candidatus Poribacteria bacterium]
MRQIKLHFACISVIFLIFISYVAMTDAETVAIWLFDEGSGKKITEFSGRGHEGEIKGGSKWVDGQFGKGLYLDSSGYIEIPHHEDFNFDKKMTIMIWAKLDDITPQEWVGMPRKGSEYVLAAHKLGNKMEMTMWVNNGGWVGQIPDGGVGPTLNFGEWHHYATTYDGDICRVYVDGKEIGGKKVGGAVNKTDAILRISRGRLKKQ